MYRDAARILADKELEDIEKRIAEIYSRAGKEVEKRATTYFKKFSVADRKKKALVDAGKLSQAEYTAWRQRQIMMGERWGWLRKQTAKNLNEANNLAVDYLNSKMPRVYAVNYNAVVGEVNRQIVGARGISFEMVDAATVKNLAMSDKTLLPYKIVDNVKDVRWNTQKVNSEILQGILQGDSIDDLAKRLRHVTEMNEASSVRNARTAITSAENKGRMDMMRDAEDKGVQTKKVWIATDDDRTREAHAELDGQEAWIDEPFENEFGKIMYPGDPDADPGNTYNCRCSLGYHVVGFWNRR